MIKSCDLSEDTVMPRYFADTDAALMKQELIRLSRNPWHEASIAGPLLQLMLCLVSSFAPGEAPSTPDASSY